MLALSVGGLATARAQAPDPLPTARRVPADAASMRLSFAPIVRRAAPAVVNVYSKRQVRAQVDPFWGMFGGGASRERTVQSLGSGSIVRADGVILTNHHNIAGASEIVVVTADRREWPATVLLDDPRADLAVLKIETKGERLPTIAIDDKDPPEVGDLVLAIGDPFGVGQTVTNGIVSALARSDVGISDYSSFIQTDAAINPGNSGGPLVDMSGDLIGVNTAILTGSGTSSGVGFAIPAATARQVIDAAVGGRHSVTRPWLGIKAQALTGEMARSLGLEAPRGVVVTQVWPGGPAARAGIAQGDVVESVDGAEVNDEAGLNYRTGAKAPGEPAQVVVRRNGAAPRTVTARLEAPPAQPAPASLTITGRNPFAGATVVNLSPAEALDRGLDPFAGEGVIITRIEGGFAQTFGLRPGDFIRQINGRKIASTADVSAALAAPAASWSVAIERGGQLITARFGAG
ncbi:MAG TPA: Do family serine endopeptidase [Caulobacteraceae bacterium]|nr:Do family serine endopeptidase [Caulobacteraceae bacterium]